MAKVGVLGKQIQLNYKKGGGVTHLISDAESGTVNKNHIHVHTHTKCYVQIVWGETQQGLYYLLSERVHFQNT